MGDIFQKEDPFSMDTSTINHHLNGKITIFNGNINHSMVNHNELERKSPLLMGKSTIVTRTVVMFNSFFYVCLPVYQLQKNIRCLPGVSHDF